MKIPKVLFLSVIWFSFNLINPIQAQTVHEYEDNSPSLLRPYFNLGYVFNNCEECNNRSGGSIRVGIVTSGKLGFYGGYTWYDAKEDSFVYDDKGSALLVGAGVAIMEKNKFRWNFQAGIAIDRFRSEYTNRTEVETSIIPQLGTLFLIGKLNIYVGMGGDNFNAGLGYTF